MKLVACAGETSEPHAFETVVGLEMSKAHLNALAFIPRFEKALCPHEPSRHITGIFVNITGYLSGSHIRTASHLQRTSIAVEFGGAVAVEQCRGQPASRGNGPFRKQCQQQAASASN